MTEPTVLTDSRQLRQSMVEQQIAARGVHDPLVLEAMRKVPTELQSHYFRARLPRQFDEYAWFDVTSAVTPLAAVELEGVPDTYPFGL